MEDATLRQGHQLDELILRENDPFTFLQNLHGNWGAVQKIGRGEVTQAQLFEALKHLKTRNPYEIEQIKAVRSYTDKVLSSGEYVKSLLEIHPYDASHVANIVRGLGKDSRADGIFVVPKPSVEAKRLEIEGSWWENPGALLGEAFKALSKKWRFDNLIGDKLTPSNLQMEESAKDALIELEKQQQGDLLVFHAQTGKRYAGASPRKALWTIEDTQGEFPLPSFVVAWMLFTNPVRMASVKDLIVDCVGDKFRFDAGGEFGGVLYFAVPVRVERLFIDGRWSDNPNDNTGSASGFVQQC